MTNVIVAGAAGRMGQRIIHMVLNHPELTLSGAFERPGSSALGKDVGAISGLGETGVTISEGIESVIDGPRSPLSTVWLWLLEQPGSVVMN